MLLGLKSNMDRFIVTPKENQKIVMLCLKSNMDRFIAVCTAQC